ncbi:cytidylate kinase-like family protein [Rhodopirellula sp. JC740]|uniref:Cytidylate kinase-like family protein n=1 Tax=Rhodopirellula halodulae TaxID=2894198 RepID=A0ABS8NI46_9BACT|nr:cytidylate kinase-like family protein [Rhodopirellula sp. JC740]MCC9643229.1 cytidylate kinase-like family protein [Rhodopirellula sp. JC740]
MTVRIPSLERRVDEKVQKWIQAQLSHETSNAVPAPKLGPYLTVSRETGAGGSELAKQVAEQLGWDLLDQEIVDYMEQHYGTPRCLIQRVDEKHESWLSELLTSRIGGLGFSESTYTHRVAKLVLLAASHGEVVIVGRGAKYLLPRENGLSIRVVAPMEARIERVMRERSLNHKQAQQHILQADRQRRTYIREHFYQDETDPHQYDIVLNMGIVSMDQATHLVMESLHQWTAIPTR